MRDRGSVTAEFAIMLPAVLIIVGLSLSSIMLATQRLSLHASAGEIARHEARGDHATASAHLARLSAGVRVHRHVTGALHCVTLRASPVGGMLRAIEVSASGCAAHSDAAEPHAARGSAVQREVTQ